MTNRKNGPLPPPPGWLLHPVRIPGVGESVTEVVVGEWLQQVGDLLEEDDALLVADTDKVSVELSATVSGILASLEVEEGDAVAVGAVVAHILTPPPLRCTLTEYLARFPDDTALLQRARGRRVCPVHNVALMTEMGWRSTMDVTPTLFWMDLHQTYPHALELEEFLDPPQGPVRSVRLVYCPRCVEAVERILKKG